MNSFIISPKIFPEHPTKSLWAEMENISVSNNK